MKKLILITALSLLGTLTSVQAQVVRVRPAAPLVVRPACPARDHVWVKDSWKWDKRKNTYVYTSGYWAKPHRKGSLWVDGHWRKSRAGWRYVSGHWS